MINAKTALILLFLFFVAGCKNGSNTATSADTTQQETSNPSAKEKEKTSSTDEIGYINDEDGYTNLRAEPSTSSNIVQQVKNGTEFTMISLHNNWVRIKLDEGSTGYVHVSRIKFKNNNPQPDNEEASSETKEAPSMVETKTSEICRSCSGTGRIRCSWCYGTGKKSCPECNGMGKISGYFSEEKDNGYQYATYNGQTDYVWIWGNHYADFPCRECNKTGKIDCSYCDGTGKKICSACNGTGRS